MNRCGDYDLPAPPPVTKDFEYKPLYEQPHAITEQPEWLYRGQSERPHLPEKKAKRTILWRERRKTPISSAMANAPQGR